MPLAQSSELPPPSATMPSTPASAATARPASTIALSGLASNAWNTVDSTPAPRRMSTAFATSPVATIPASETMSTLVKPSSRDSSPRRWNVPSPKTTRVRR